MKIFTGIFLFLLVLTAGILAVLALWGVYPLSWSVIWRSALTLLIASATLATLRLAATRFLCKDKITAKGSKAHLMN